LVLVDTRYALSGDVHVAYRVFGHGPLDLVLVGGLDFPSVDFHEEVVSPEFVALTERMRVIRFDKRGTGSSDRVSGVPSLEERMDDVRAVMDAAGSERAAILGHVDGAAMAILFAATYPDRVFALALVQAKPRFVRAPDFPWAPTREAYERETQEWLAEAMDAADWVRASARREGRDVSEDEARQRARMQRLTLSPGGLIALRRMNMDIDVRSVLSTIHIPTLIAHRSADMDDPTDTSATAIANYIAEQIPDARVVEFGRFDRMPYDAVFEFTQEAWQRRANEPRRVLATVLFTDLVASTATAVEHGREWPNLLARHNAAIRRELARFRGETIDTAGDGFFASGFDGPARAIRCGCAIRDAVAGIGLGIRVGVHTGECDIVDDKLSGLAVNVGARVAAQADEGEVLVSGTVKDLVAGSGIAFEPRGVRELKGLGEWPLYAVTNPYANAAPVT
jgi:class 3 adenylate cyclase/pimeloyl-ACP methyl ester carboxylesterase